MQYIKGVNNGGADGLSRLPLDVKHNDQEPEEDYFNFLIEDKMPVDSKQIRKETRTDVILSKVYDYIRYGWPSKVDDELKPYWMRSHELNIESDILLWGYRVIVPNKLRIDLMREIHSTHLGSSKMKALARQYFWWPNLDKDIERYSKNCEVCNKVASSPNKAELIKYNDSNKPLERVHMDFLGPIQNKNYLIITDSFSKWPEIYGMSKMDANSTVERVRDYCARYGLPEKIISDNGRQFVSGEFETFCKMNKIIHKTTAPYNPSTNGAAENAVKSFKSGLKKALIDPKNRQVSIETLISRYLLSYRTAPHCATGETPAKLMFNRQLRTRFDAIKENVRNDNNNRQIKNYSGHRSIQFDLGNLVWVRDYRCPSKPSWAKAEIVEILGPRNYLCSLVKEKVLWKRHVNQMRRATSMFDEYTENEFEKENERVNIPEVIVKPTMVQIPEIPSDVTNEDCIVLQKKVREEEMEKRPISENNIEQSVDKDNLVSIKDQTPKKLVLDKELGTEQKTASKINKDSTVGLNVNERPKRTIKKPNRLNL